MESNMAYIQELQRSLECEPKLDCESFTSYFLLDAERECGRVVLRLEPHQSLENRFGNIPNGLAVSMIDVLISVSAFAKTNAWIPIIEVKCSFMDQVRFGECRGEALVIRTGEHAVFLEARLWGADLRLAVHATATAGMPR